MNSKNGKSKNAQANLNTVVNEVTQKDPCIQRVRQTLGTFVWGLDELVKSAIIVDANVLASNPITFITDNLFQYMVAISLWLILTQDVYGDKVLEADLRDAIAKWGLAKTVDVVKSAFTAVLHNETDELFKSHPWLVYPCNMLHMKPTVPQTSWFRFLTRFSPISSDRRNRETERAFFDHNDAIEFDPFKRKGQYLTKIIALGPISKIREFRFDYGKFQWSNGVCNDGSTVGEKLAAFAKFTPNLGSPLYPLQGGARAPWRYNCVTPMVVPKNFKTPRIIAPVSSYCGAMSHQLRIHLTDELLRITGIDLSKAQDVNRHMAQQGSLPPIHGDDNLLELATIDESQASDSCPWDTYTRVFPSSIVKAMSEVREDVFINKHRFSHVRMAFASGNPSTFVSETWFFYSCGETACWYAAYFSDVEDKEGLYHEYLMLLFVYGDDVVIPTAAAETFMDIIAAYGIVANRDKSYLTGPFRESCGGEYVNGSEVQSYYWPREEVSSKSPIKAAFTLCDMHNKFFNGAEYRSLSRLLKSLTLKLYPKMTVQEGFQYSDLHDPMGTLAHRTAPVGGFYDVRLTNVIDKHVKESPDGSDPNWLSTPVRDVVYRTITAYQKHRVLDTSKFYLPEDIDGNPEQYVIRDVHSVLSTTYKEYIPNDNLEMFLYVDFLEKGPYYADPLDEILGVSSPRYLRKTLTDKGREEVKRVY